jgi:hypothetical protein
MRAYIEPRPDFGMASAARYQEAMRSAGFVEISATSRNAGHRERPGGTRKTPRPAGAAAAQIVGQVFVDHNIAIWTHGAGAGKRRALPHAFARAQAALSPVTARLLSRDRACPAGTASAPVSLDAPTRAWAPPGAESEKQAEAPLGSEKLNPSWADRFTFSVKLMTEGSRCRRCRSFRC